MRNKILMEKIDTIVIFSSLPVWMLPAAIVWSAPANEAFHVGTGIIFLLSNLPVIYLLFAVARTKRFFPVAPYGGKGAIVSIVVFLAMMFMRNLIVFYGIFQYILIITIIGSLSTVYYLISVLLSFYDINYIG